MDDLFTIAAIIGFYQMGKWLGRIVWVIYSSYKD